MGTYEKQDKDHKNHTNNNPEHRKKRDTHRKINSMTQKQKLKWIKEGD